MSMSVQLTALAKMELTVPTPLVDIIVIVQKNSKEKIATKASLFYIIFFADFIEFLPHLQLGWRVEQIKQTNKQTR